MELEEGGEVGEDGLHLRRIEELAQRFQRARDARARDATAASPHDDASRVLREYYGYDEVMLAGINSYRDRHSKTRLLNAAIAGTTREVNALLALGADTHARSFGGWTALHYAAKKGHEQIIPPLVLAGADVDQRIRVRGTRARARRRARGSVRASSSALPRPHSRPVAPPCTSRAITATRGRCVNCSALARTRGCETTTTCRLFTSRKSVACGG